MKCLFLDKSRWVYSPGLDFGTLPILPVKTPVNGGHHRRLAKTLPELAEIQHGDVVFHAEDEYGHLKLSRDWSRD